MYQNISMPFVMQYKAYLPKVELLLNTSIRGLDRLKIKLLVE